MALVRPATHCIYQVYMPVLRVWVSFSINMVGEADGEIFKLLTCLQDEADISYSPSFILCIVANVDA